MEMQSVSDYDIKLSIFFVEISIQSANDTLKTKLTLAKTPTQVKKNKKKKTFFSSTIINHTLNDNSGKGGENKLTSRIKGDNFHFLTKIITEHIKRFKIYRISRKIIPLINKEPQLGEYDQ